MWYHSEKSPKAFLYLANAVYLHIVKVVWWWEDTSWSQHRMGERNGRSVHKWNGGYTYMLQFHLQYCDLDLLKTLSTCNIEYHIHNLRKSSHCPSRWMAEPSVWSGLPPKETGLTSGRNLGWTGLLSSWNGLIIYTLGTPTTKACCLYSGFSSARVCHLCNGQEPG